MPYLNVDPNYFEHPKTRRLIGLLGPLADILPIRLWAYCAKIHPIDGKLKGYSAAEIEGIIGWQGTPKEAVAALSKVGFISESKDGFQCVDWQQHEGHLAAFSRRGRENAKKRWEAYASSNAASNAKTSVLQCSSRTNHTNKTNTEPEHKNSLIQPSDGFAEFWEAYPKKQGKADALKAWSRLKPGAELQAIILQALKAQSALHNGQDGWKYFKHAQGWLNSRRWEDELTTAKKASPFYD